jgi:hypothetical protein
MRRKRPLKDRRAIFTLIFTAAHLAVASNLCFAADVMGALPEEGIRWRAHVIHNISKGYDGTHTADVNGDGLPDVVSGCEEANEIVVALHPGYAKVRQPWPTVTLGPIHGPEWAMFMDLDDDGNVDVVGCSQGQSKDPSIPDGMNVFWAPAKKDYLDASKWTRAAFQPGTIMVCKPAQVDGKHGLDIITPFYWLEAPANPGNRDLSAWQRHPLPGRGAQHGGGNAMSLLWVDMNGDGHNDVLANNRSLVHWFENPGPGEAQRGPWKQHVIAEKKGANPMGFKFMSVADMDRDGLTDLVVSHSDGLFIFRRLDKSGDRWEKRLMMAFGKGSENPDLGHPKSATAGDVDGDGENEIICSMPWIEVKRNPRTDTWSWRRILPEREFKWKSDEVLLMDLDGDGDLDILSSREVGSQLFWVENLRWANTRRPKP